VNEEDLYQLMVVATKQQEAVAMQLAALEKQQTQLTATIGQAKRSIEAMENAGVASAGLIERATKMAVDKAVADALEGVSKAASESLANAVNPAVNALRGVTARAVETEESMRAATSSFGWKWIGVLLLTSFMLLTTIVGLSLLLVPSPNEIANMRANLAALEARGGKIRLTTCNDRLCAEIDPKAEKGVQFGENGQRWLILKGY